MEKGEKFVRDVDVLFPIEVIEPCGDFVDGWRIESGSGEHCREWVGIGTSGDATPQGGLERRSAATHERIENDFAGLREIFDEMPCERGLEASTVGNFVERMGLALCIGSASIGKNRGVSYGMGGLVLTVDFAL